VGFGEIIAWETAAHRPFSPCQGEKVARGRMRGLVFEQTQRKKKAKQAPSP